jgi:hypothetical protein
LDGARSACTTWVGRRPAVASHARAARSAPARRSRTRPASSPAAVSSWPPVRVAQWLLERLTIRAAGEHFTRRQLPLVRAAGFDVVEVERLKAGSVERVHASKPAGG